MENQVSTLEETRLLAGRLTGLIAFLCLPSIYNAATAFPSPRHASSIRYYALLRPVRRESLTRHVPRPRQSVKKRPAPGLHNETRVKPACAGLLILLVVQTFLSMRRIGKNASKKLRKISATLSLRPVTEKSQA